MMLPWRKKRLTDPEIEAERIRIRALTARTKLQLLSLEKQREAIEGPSVRVRMRSEHNNYAHEMELTYVPLKPRTV